MQLQTIKFIPDVCQNKFVSEQVHNHLQTLGEHNSATESRKLFYKMQQILGSTWKVLEEQTLFLERMASECRQSKAASAWTAAWNSA